MQRVIRGASAVAVAVVAAVLGWTAQSGATTIDGCSIVASPSPGQVTSCPYFHFTDPLPKPVDLSGADLNGSSFAPESVTGLDGANLSYADVAQTSLVDVDLSGTDLSGANLTNADLRGADLSDATLTGAVLNGANLTDANLSGADLTGASINPVTWSGTTCPDAANSDSVGGTCVNDSSVASGFATGAAQGPSATANTTAAPGAPDTGFTQTVPYTEDTGSSPVTSSASSEPILAFTGAPVDTLAPTGLTLVIVGLLLSFGSVPRRWRRTRRPSRAQ
jgi:Pentapeptide repeats (8 copies)